MTASQRQFPCERCGAALEYQPGTVSLVCPYCGQQQTVEKTGELASTKHDFVAYYAAHPEPVASLPPVSLACTGCGTTVERTAISARCRSCGAPLVSLDDVGGRLHPPDAALPFAVDNASAQELFGEWTRSRWFAPNGLKRVARTQSLQATYLPHWGFDDQTVSDHRGERGDYYYVTETYTTTENGQSVTRTRQVRHTRWRGAQGRVDRHFVDLVVPGCTGVPAKELADLGPWQVGAASPYAPALLAGIDTPRYDVDAGTDGWQAARAAMAPVIESDCRRDIGGDEQRVHEVQTQDRDVLFRLLLFPLWLALYVYAGTTYRVYVNANTGEVVGKRPYSWVKITLTVLLAIALIAGGVVLYQLRSTG